MGMLDALARYSKRRSRHGLYPWLADTVRCHRLAGAGRVLNVGAGGEVAAALAQNGVRATSVDIDPARGPHLVASLEALEGVADSSVDALFCLEVLEHVARPEAAAGAIGRVLRPGGLLVGSTPFLLGIHDAPHDYFRYTAHGLRQLFAGFDEVELRARNGYFAAAAVLLTRRFAVGSLPERRRAALLSPVLIPLAAAVSSLDGLLPSAEGTTGYVFVFRRR